MIKIDGVIRKLTELKRAFDMKGANATTMERAINTLRDMSPVTEPVEFEYRIEISTDDQGHVLAGRDRWVREKSLPVGTTLEQAKEYLRVTRRSVSRDKEDCFRLTCRPAQEWEPVE